MLLTDDEIKAVWKTDRLPGEAWDVFNLRIHRAIIAAVIDKLTAGVEVPKSNYIVMSTGESAITVTQALQYGASQRLAGREQAIEEAKQAVSKGCASPTAANIIEQLKGQP